MRELDEDALVALVGKALAALGQPFSFRPDALASLVRLAEGDARRLLVSVETLAQIVPRGTELDLDGLERCLQTGTARNLGSEDHFNWISALHKSVRGSDPHAAIYWLAQMLEAGEDPRYVARRLVRMAAEDIGLAEPGALQLALSAREAFELLGVPEGKLALAQCAVYLALCPKSDSVYRAYGAATELIERHGTQPVPLHLRNAPTRLMNELGYGKGYRSAQDAPNRFIEASYLPERHQDRSLYRPSDQGREARMVDDHGRRTGDFFRLRAKDVPGGAADAPEESS
ncbi:MAG: hypothetical protein R3E97_08930 [Candidatus Eisenbacteria bacterium]